MKQTSKITEGIYTYYTEATEEEIDILKRCLAGGAFTPAAITEETFDAITARILLLPFTEQVHALHAILDTLYSLNDSDPVIEKFLAQKEFWKHRDVIMTAIDNIDGDTTAKENLKNLENELSIKIIETEYDETI